MKYMECVKYVKYVKYINSSTRVLVHVHARVYRILLDNWLSKLCNYGSRDHFALKQLRPIEFIVTTIS